MDGMLGDAIGLSAGLLGMGLVVAGTGMLLNVADRQLGGKTEEAKKLRSR